MTTSPSCTTRPTPSLAMADQPLSPRIVASAVVVWVRGLGSPAETSSTPEHSIAQVQNDAISCERSAVTLPLFTQLSQPAGGAGGPGAPAAEPATEELALAIGRVWGVARASVAARRVRPATPRHAFPRPSGPPGAAGVGALPAVEEADRAGPGGASMATHAVEPPLYIAAATARSALQLQEHGLPGPPGLLVLLPVVEVCRPAADSASESLARVSPHDRRPAAHTNVSR